MPNARTAMPRSSNRSIRSARPASRQQVRTDATCSKLLAAAEKVFARDGFEAARLADIAALAGYTRGAFYAHFKSKEDIFFALLEDWIGRRIAEVDAVLERHADPAARLRALREHYAHTATDRRLTLLSLEFKLFAIRHPQAHSRLRARQRPLRENAGNILRRVAKDAGAGLAVSGVAAATALGALSNALLLEHLVDHVSISDADVRHLLGVFFDAVLEP
ncbi:MAG TPA: helix-turn-helix domain-containing protein [Candidatus Dormibacteraeota bacterium]|nr:helix-turn-helix domain-containing protein [Candidatus Dormibacteraeota bacterium]